MRVLVVDDSTTMRRILAGILTRIGHDDCAEAESGREALESLAAGTIDVVIVDWNMPAMTGIEFVRAMRANESTRSLPVLIMTTNARKDDIVEAQRAGVDGYLVKPFTPEILKEKIDAALRRREPHAPSP